MAIINVSPPTPTNPTPIQDAVDSASEGDVILVENGTYPEEVDITTDNIRIVANGKNVILDGTMGSLSVAFVLDGVTGLEIKGFKIQNYGTGIIVYNGGFNRIIRNNIMDIGTGILINDSSGNLVWRNVVKGGSGGFIGILLDLIEGSSNWLIENVTQENTFGVVIMGITENNVLIANRSFNNTTLGFLTNGAINTLILDNESFDNGQGASLLLLNSVLINNKIKDNGDDGVEFFGIMNNFVSENEIQKNSRSGINIMFSDFNIFQENKIKKNKETGMNIDTNSDNNTIIRNDIKNNTPADIVDNGTDNNFVDNKTSNK